MTDSTLIDRIDKAVDELDMTAPDKFLHPIDFKEISQTLKDAKLRIRRHQTALEEIQSLLSAGNFDPLDDTGKSVAANSAWWAATRALDATDGQS